MENKDTIGRDCRRILSGRHKELMKGLEVGKCNTIARCSANGADFQP